MFRLRMNKETFYHLVQRKYWRKSPVISRAGMQAVFKDPNPIKSGARWLIQDQTLRLTVVIGCFTEVQGHEVDEKCSG